MNKLFSLIVSIFTGLEAVQLFLNNFQNSVTALEKQLISPVSFLWIITTVPLKSSFDESENRKCS